MSSTPPMHASGAPESSLAAEGPVSQSTVDLLDNLTHTHEEEPTFDSVPDPAWKHLPWWKRPSPYWILCSIPLGSMFVMATMAPKIEIYTQLVCATHKPEISDSFLLNSTCASDPTVQAIVAKLSTVILGCMGVLSCLTTGWWGSCSDRYGRRNVFGLSIVGLLATDLNFLLVMRYYRSLPGGYWFLIVGPLLEGCLGGMATAMAATHSYLADTTTAATRSRVFSVNLGLIFAGMALGPTIGGLMIKWSGTARTVFYVAAGAHLIYALFIWLVLPESLPNAQRQQSRFKHAESMRSLEGASLATRAKWMFSFLSPLSIFFPAMVAHNASHANPLKRTRKDWNLSLIAAAYGFTISVMGSYTYKFQYAAGTFGWSSADIGYWLSAVGATRAVFLAVVLPYVIRTFKPKPPVTTTTAVVDSDGPQDHSAKFELALARFSLTIEIISYSAMALMPSPAAFVLFGMFSAFGVGFSPASQTVALELYRQQGGTESGKLFGGLSVVQAISGQILGPALYGLVYMKTVATFPRAIFFVTVLTLFISFALLACVRLHKHPQAIFLDSDEEAGAEADETSDTATLLRKRVDSTPES